MLKNERLVESSRKFPKENSDLIPPPSSEETTCIRMTILVCQYANKHIAFSDEGPSVAVAALGFGTCWAKFRRTKILESQRFVPRRTRRDNSISETGVEVRRGKADGRERKFPKRPSVKTRTFSPHQSGGADGNLAHSPKGHGCNIPSAPSWSKRLTTRICGAASAVRKA